MKRAPSLLAILLVLALLIGGGIWLHDRGQEVEAVVEATTQPTQIESERPIFQGSTVPVPEPVGPDSLPMSELGLEQRRVDEPETVAQTVLVDSSSERTRLLVREEGGHTFFPELREKLFDVRAGGISVEKLGEEGGHVVVADVPEPGVQLELRASFGAGWFPGASGRLIAGPFVGLDLVNVYGIHLGGFAALGTTSNRSWVEMAAGPSAAVEVMPNLQLRAGADLMTGRPQPFGGIGYSF